MGMLKTSARITVILKAGKDSFGIAPSNLKRKEIQTAREISRISAAIKNNVLVKTVLLINLTIEFF